MAVKKYKVKKDGKAEKVTKNTKPKKSSKISAGKDAPEAVTGSVTPWILAIVAFFMLLTIVLPDMGAAGNFIKEWIFIKPFGAAYYYLTVLLGFLAVVWRKTQKQGWLTFRVLISVLQFIFTAIILHFVCTGKFTEMNVYDCGVIATSEEISIIGAGYVGGFISMGFSYLISGVATFIFAVLGFLVSTVLMFGKTPGDVFKTVIRKIKESNLAREAAAELRKAEQQDAEAEQVKTFKPEQKKIRPIVASGVPSDKTIDLSHGENEQEQPKFTLPVYDEPAEPKKPEPEILEAVEVKETKLKEPEKAPETIPEVIETSDASVTEDEEQSYVFPPLSLLTKGEEETVNPAQNDVERISEKLVEIMNSFGVKVKVVGAACGPTVTRYEVMPEVGVRVRTIMGLQDDLKLHLGAKNVRIENIPGKTAVGIEIPNSTSSVVHLRDLLENETFQKSKSPLLCALGLDVTGKPVYMDFEDKLHVLVAGATGMGKSVCINSIIMSLLYRATPDDLRLIMIDPKRLEFARYDGLPHLLVPVVIEPKKAAGTLNWACMEMDRRYQLMQDTETSKLTEYNAAIKDDPEKEHLPNIVIIIDELADLMMTAPDDVEKSICRLAQKARAAGIYLLIGTQRPSVDVITGLIKANMPTRISFAVKSQIDSRTVLDLVGAERLVGKGDMLYYPTGMNEPVRVQGAFVDGKSEVVSVCTFIRSAAKAEYNENVLAEIERQAASCGNKGGRKGDDEDAAEDGGADKDEHLIIKALEIAFNEGTISTTMIQNRLELGYARAARVVSKLERRGYIGAFDTTAKKRPILISKEEYLALKLNHSDDAASGGDNE